MTKQQKEEITRISQEFAFGFIDRWPTINGTGWFIVDPLAGLLELSGYKNTALEMPANDKHPQVLILEFEDGSKFIPAGGDLSVIDKHFTNWMWI